MYTNIGIDLGTDYTRIFAGRGIVLNEPSVIAVDHYTGEPIEYGQKAAEMIGRTSDRVEVSCPIERGAIADFDMAQLMLKEYMRRACGRKMIKPRVMVTMPSGVTSVQQRSIVDAMESAGARNVCLIEGPLAVAIGLEVDFSTPRATTVIDIGKGTCDIAVLSMGGLAQCESARMAGADFDEAIVRYVRKEHNILIGVRTAEEIKKQIGCVVRRQIEVGMTAKGLNLFTGLPQLFEVTNHEIYEALSDSVEAMVKAIHGVLEKTPPELAADISREGIVLCGGGALIFGMEQLLSERLGAPVTLVEDPLCGAVRGTGKALSDLKVLRNGNYRFRTLKDLVIE